MKLPPGVSIRREHELSEAEVRQLRDWSETKRLADKRMTDSHRRYTEAKAIFEGLVSLKKYELEWANADNVVFDTETGKLYDLVAGVDEDGRCQACGQVHDPEDHD